MSKMGTIDRIVDVLNKSRDDRILAIDNRFKEHKHWMAEEFENVRNLITKNSTRVAKKEAKSHISKSSVNNQKLGSVASSSSKLTRHNAESAAIPQATKAAPKAIAQSVTSNVAQKEPETINEAKKNKRKSPEEATRPEKLSPENKRNSSDFEKIVLQAGLPSDLNRLKKESLLKELAVRGNNDLTMKSLKKDMVETLKRVLLEQGKASPEKVETAENDNEDLENRQMSESSQSLREFHKASPPQKTKSPDSPRKGSSTMSDIRKELNSTSSALVETEEERKKRTAEEFKRRLSNTQARKSEGKIDEAIVAPIASTKEVHEPEPEKPITPPPAPKMDRDSDIMISEDGSTWMEVASPQPVNSMANLKTNISKETNAMSTPSHKVASQVFIKQEKGMVADMVVSDNTNKPNDAAESVTKQTPMQSNQEHLTNANGTKSEAPASVVNAAMPLAPTPTRDTSTNQPSSAVKSSAKKGLFSFLSSKVKEEKIDPPVPVQAAPSTPHASSQSVAASGGMNALRSGAKKALEEKMYQQQQEVKEKADAHQQVQAQAQLSPYQQGADEYKIHGGDSSGSDSGTDDEEESKAKQKRIPEWARGVQLKEQLERQYGLHGHPSLDPDLIFPEVVSCSLEEIFGATVGKSGAYNKRGSSAHWDADELTLIEKRTYRSQMGLSN